MTMAVVLILRKACFCLQVFNSEYSLNTTAACQKPDCFLNALFSRALGGHWRIIPVRSLYAALPILFALWFGLVIHHIFSKTAGSQIDTGPRKRVLLNRLIPRVVFLTMWTFCRRPIEGRTQCIWFSYLKPFRSTYLPKGLYFLWPIGISNHCFTCHSPLWLFLS